MGATREGGGVKTLTIKGDLELSAAVAEHVAGYVLKPVPLNYRETINRWHDGEKLLYNPRYERRDFDTPLYWEPEFATSADAVLPLCEQFPMTTFQHACAESKPGVRWIVEILVESPKRDSSPYIDGRGQTLARSLCLALLRAKGFQVEFAP